MLIDLRVSSLPLRFRRSTAVSDDSRRRLHPPRRQLTSAPPQLLSVSLWGLGENPKAIRSLRPTSTLPERRFRRRTVALCTAGK
jgi:hypothetical protein